MPCAGVLPCAGDIVRYLPGVLLVLFECCNVFEKRRSTGKFFNLGDINFSEIPGCN